MPFSGVIRILRKMVGYTLVRPVLRFNVNNRAKKYLGPEAPKFMPAPRAIGPMSQAKKPVVYPHLAHGENFKSVQTKRLQAMDKYNLVESTPQQSIEVEKDRFIIDTSKRLEVNKIVHEENIPMSIQVKSKDDNTKVSTHRPLPKLTSLQLSDPASIWVVNKTPPGRLNLDQLQEIMINKLADNDNYWTPERIASRYKIKEKYAESLCNYLKHITIHISPKLANLMDYTSRDDPLFQATKHIIYVVRSDLRSDEDKKYDKMYLPTDQPPTETVKELIGEIGSKPVNQKLPIIIK